jgi:WD40 repeat protein
MDMPKQAQLFALDPEREAAVIPLIPRSVQDSLPAKLDFYEPSPDGKRVAISGEKGAVVVLTLATGKLDTVQAAGKEDTVCAPAWRSATELCYVFTTNGQPAQVAFWNNGTNRVLSAKWPADVRKGFLDK